MWIFQTINFTAVITYALLLSTLIACGGSGGKDNENSQLTGETRIYVSVVHHNEEYGDFVENMENYEGYREDLLALGEYLFGENIVMNFQSDWNFLAAVDRHETSDSPYIISSNGKNIVRYFKEDLGHEIDPHAHETEYNYADVAFLIEQLGVMPSDIVGGFLAIPPGDSDYQQFLSPMQGWVYPAYAWQAEWLWGGDSLNHANDIHASGVWNPKDSTSFFEHDDNAPLPCIGNYTKTMDGIYDLLGKLESGLLKRNTMYTASFFVGWEAVEESMEELQRELPLLRQYEEEDKLVFASLEEIGRTWRRSYDSRGNVYICN
jgi:hypothetical protein